ncbi:MAG: hypothetical protein ABIZ05_11420 [Pseudonocardiaceae bacterium]
MDDDGEQAARHAILVIRSGVEVLRGAPLAGSDIARQKAAMCQVVLDLAEACMWRYQMYRDGSKD